MEVTKETLDRLKSLSDDQLREAIGSIADAFGASPAQKKLALNHTGLIRRKLSGASEKEVNRQLSRLDPEKQRILSEKLKW